MGHAATRLHYHPLYIHNQWIDQMSLDTFIEELVIINDRLNDALGELSWVDRKVVEEEVNTLKHSLLDIFIKLRKQT